VNKFALSASFAILLAYAALADDAAQSNQECLRFADDLGCSAVLREPSAQSDAGNLKPPSYCKSVSYDEGLGKEWVSADEKLGKEWGVVR
jgi:hypothetical protein